MFGLKAWIEGLDKRLGLKAWIKGLDKRLGTKFTSLTKGNSTP